MDMTQRALLLVGLGFVAFVAGGCATRARESANATGCSAGEVIVWNESADAKKETWTATCGQKQYRCAREITLAGANVACRRVSPTDVSPIELSSN